MLHQLVVQFTRVLNTVTAGINLPGREKKVTLAAFSEIWERDVDFMAVWQQIKARTLVPRSKCYMIWQLVRYADGLDGDAAEVGVYKGGTARLIATATPKKGHFFDTFAGMPETDKEVDKHRQGDFSDTSFSEVQTYLSDLRNAYIYPGAFPETATAVSNRRFAFVYVDVDIYQSVKRCLEFFYPRTVKGGIILLDDYEWHLTPGVSKAVHEFMEGKSERPIIMQRHLCLIIRY